MPPTAPADAAVNQFIPDFISRKPFYVDDRTVSETDYLEHQRLQTLPEDTLSQSKWYDRGRKLGPAATKFRKGACENCGAMTHKTKECLSRPRKQGARWTGRDIQADEVVEDVKLGWDAKRDRWNGYDAREYSAVVKEYEELEAMKRAATGTSGQDRIRDGQDGEEANEPEVESAKYAEETDMGRNQPTSTRNLRIREDTAKYLLNLDLDSAKYDPKTRSMAHIAASRDNNGNEADDNASSLLADENFTRSSGDAAEFDKAQRYAWETQEKGAPGSKKLHLQANPTEGEILRKKQTEDAERKREANRKALLERYGGSEHLQPAPFRAAENERYVEYDETGGVKGEVRKAACSKYREDVFVNNHTTVWGSWWFDFRWGYACCHSTVKNSYCTGEEGRRAFDEAERLKGGELLPPLLPEKDATSGPEAGSGEDVTRQTERASEVAPEQQVAAKKRTLQEMRDGVTEEELEAFKRNRAVAADPMGKLLGRDELVH